MAAGLMMACLALGSFAQAATAEDIAGFALAPLLVEVKTDPGRSSRHTLTVSNTSDSRQTYTISKEDIAGNKNDPYANPVLLGAERPSPISGYRWLEGFPSTISVPAGSTESFTVTVNAPNDATGGHYAAIIVSAAAKDAGDVTAQSRVASLFMMNAGGVPPPEIVIEDVVVTEDGETIVDYVNHGQKEVKPDATITYVDPITGETVAVRSASECSTALPDGIGRCEFEALGEDALDGALLTRPEITVSNDGRTAKAKLPTQWNGGAGSIVLPLVGLGLLGAYFLRRRRPVLDDDDFFSL